MWSCWLALVALPATGSAADPDKDSEALPFQSGRLNGLQIKARAALIDLQGTPGLLPDVRLILNLPIPLL